uniref:Uncharacterized protein n=1 Tax=Panagrolaimus sp. PS1159 TaxID=55785 RepID=A0AC35F1M2_9BILA
MNASEIFPYIVLFQLIISVFIQTFMVFKCFYIIKRKSVIANFSATLILYFYYLFLTSISLGGCNIYAIIVWRPSETEQNATILYFGGIISWILLVSNPIFEFCLCIERCFAIYFPVFYNQRLQHFMHFISIFCFAFFVILFIFLNGILKLPKEKNTSCPFFECIFYQTIERDAIELKIILSAIDVSSAVLLLFLLKFKFKNNGNSEEKSLNKTVYLIILATTAFEVTPNFIDYILLKVIKHCFFSTFKTHTF